MVRKARTGWERATQVLYWLVDEFELPEDTTLERVASIDGDETFGRVVERNGRLVIQLSEKLCRSVAHKIEVTIHEAAHVKLYARGLGHFHGPPYWAKYGEMMDAFDHHGFQDSRAYPVE